MLTALSEYFVVGSEKYDMMVLSVYIQLLWLLQHVIACDVGSSGFLDCPFFSRVG